MSTLTVSTISNGSVSTSSTNVIQGSAKAWVNFNPSSSSIRASFNVSSVTYNSTGKYQVNFTNNMVDANYAVTVASRRVTFNDANWSANIRETASGSGTNYPFTTSSCLFSNGNCAQGAFADTDLMCVSVFR